MPEFLAASFSGTLPELEAAAAVSERAASISEAARQLRPELDDERTAVRWLRRRLSAIGQGLTALVTALPELWGTVPTLSAVGAKLGAPAGAILVRLRVAGASLLSALAAPLGFCHRRTAVRNGTEALQHTVGPAPG